MGGRVVCGWLRVFGEGEGKTAAGAEGRQASGATEGRPRVQQQMAQAGFWVGAEREAKRLGRYLYLPIPTTWYVQVVVVVKARLCRPQLGPSQGPRQTQRRSGRARRRLTG